MKINIKKITLFMAIIMGTAIVVEVAFNQNILIQSAEARGGRHHKHHNHHNLRVAGVARRTTRRAIRRSTIFVSTLPANCTTIVVEGAVIQHCGGTYYQPSGNRYIVVYID